MEKELELYMHIPYPLRVTPEETTENGLCYLAEHPDLPGCMSHGDSPEEAIGSLAEARKLYITTLLKRRESVPLPSTFLTHSSLQLETAIWEVYPNNIKVTTEEAFPHRLIQKEGRLEEATK